MPETGIIVLPQPGGKVIATRGAAELDAVYNTRMIPLIDLVEEKLASPIGAATRAAVTVADPRYIWSFPADLSNNLITCGDATTLIVWAEFATSIASQSVDVQPIVYDTEVTPGVIMPLDTEVFSVSSSVNPYRNTGSLGTLSHALLWDITGASNIGLRIPALTVDTNVSVWGRVI